MTSVASAVRGIQPTASVIDHARRVRVVHPFHPLAGRELELLDHGYRWGQERVFFCERGQARVRSLPASWTDLVDADPFVVIAAGRCFCRPEELLQLAGLLAGLGERDV